MRYMNRIKTHWYHILAKRYIDNNFPLKGINYLLKAIQLSPANKELYFSLALAYQKDRKWDKSIDSIKNALALFPNDLGILWMLGTWLLDLERPSDAWQYLNEYLKRLPQDDKYRLASAYAVLGVCCLFLDKWNEAEKFLEKSRNLVPWDLDACAGTIQLYQKTGRIEKILGLINEYIHEYPHLYPFYAWKGHYFQYSLHRPIDSLEWYKTALEKMSNPETRKYCEAYLFTFNMFDKILDEYVEALFSCGKSDDVFPEIQKYEKYRLGSIVESNKRLIRYYTNVGDFEKAEIAINNVPQNIRETPEILLSVAIMKDKRGDTTEAIENIRKAISLDDEYLEAFDVLGSIQIENKIWKDALTTYTRLTRRSPQVSHWLRNVGLCYLQLNQLENACKYYEESLRFDKFDADTWVSLGDVYSKLGNSDLALSSYQMGLEHDWLDIQKRQHALQAIAQLKSS